MILSRHGIKLIVFILTGVFVFSTNASAKSLNDVIQSMKQRAPLIKQLKVKGIVGENSKGYLEFVGASREQAAQVAAENADRKLTYQYVARKEQTSLAVVESRMGKRKAQKADPGEFFQKPDGSWQKK